jgi:hypothetical protein
MLGISRVAERLLAPQVSKLVVEMCVITTLQLLLDTSCSVLSYAPKLCVLRAMKAEESGGEAPRILNLGTGWRYVGYRPPTAAFLLCHVASSTDEATACLP